MNILVIIPTLNEKENLANLLPALFSYRPDFHVLIVDDNSDDGTEEFGAELKRKYPNLNLLIRKENRGYGRSILEGLGWSLKRNYDRVVTMDADFSHDYKVIPALVTPESNVTIGSRYIKGGSIENWQWYRRILSRFANLYVRIILGINFLDTTTGFVCYDRKAVAELVNIGTTSDGYAFLVESKYRLFRKGYSFNEVPIIFRERRVGKSKMSWEVIWESIWRPWRLKFGLK